jgi:esterase/lipase superfamily enzyme
MAASPLTKIWLYSSLLLALAGCAAFQQQPVTGVDHVSVYYATTRRYDPAASLDHAFTNVPTKNEFINFGTAEVTVPLPHREGVQTGLKVARIEPPKKDGQGDFSNRTRAETSDPKRPLVVFVHGFNNSFETAAERAALFSHDLQPDVSMKAAVFSWPSHESLFGYLADEDSVLVSQDRTRQVVEILRTHDSASPVVLIGHSMGVSCADVCATRYRTNRQERKAAETRAPAICAADPDRAGCRCGVFQDKHRATSRDLRTCHGLRIES